MVEVEGVLRRRFWRGAAGPASRYEVEVVALRRLPAGSVEVGAANRRVKGGLAA